MTRRLVVTHHNCTRETCPQGIFDELGLIFWLENCVEDDAINVVA